jgi:antitoxin Phd
MDGMKAASVHASRNSSPSNAVTATNAKNEFGKVLEKVLRGDVMFITRHGSAKAVLMPVEQYRQYMSLKSSPEVQLDELRQEFDELLERMQTLRSRTAMDRAFHATPKQLGRAAVRGAARHHAQGRTSADGGRIRSSTG